MSCPACRFAVAADAADSDHGTAWCIGAAHALAAQHANDTSFPFSLCPEHAKTIREEMESAVDARQKARRPS